MSQISIIKKSEIEKAKRFDAEYFKPEYLEIEKRLEKIENSKIRELKEIVYRYPTFFDIKYCKEGHLIIKGEDLKELSFIESKNNDFIDNETHNRFPRTILKEKDLVFSVRGLVGKTGLITNDLENSNISANMIRISLNEKKINPFFVYIFLNSIFGLKQIERVKMITAQETIVSTDILNLKIPLLPQSFQLEIEKIVKEAKQKQEQSKQLYKEAEQILLKELNLTDFKTKHTPTFQTTKKEVEQAKRFDAEYFQPKYDEIIKHIENYKFGCEKIKELVKWKKGFEVGSDKYLEEGFEFGRVSDFTKYGFESSSKKISKKTFEELKENFQAKRGEILFTKDGTIGISHLLKEDFNGILSSAFLRLKQKKEFDEECLTLILNSILTKLQVEKLSGGALINHLKPSDFQNLKIPLISQNTQKQISSLTEKSHALRKQSKELLEEAKRKVEKEIENKTKK